jgi:hypothetical protein
MRVGGGGGASPAGENPSRVCRRTGEAAPGTASTGGSGCVTVPATAGAGAALVDGARIGSGGGGGAAAAMVRGAETATTCGAGIGSGGGPGTGRGAASAADAVCTACCAGIGWVSVTSRAADVIWGGAGKGAGGVDGAVVTGFTVRLIGAMPSSVCLRTGRLVAPGAGASAGEVATGPGAGTAGASSSQDGLKLSASRSASSRLNGADDGGPLPG